MRSREGAPVQLLGGWDAVAIVVGLVIGAGIFKAPAVVAAHAGSEAMLLGLWLLGGLVSILGALCYAELAAAFPHAGGEYHFLHRAYGPTVGFLFGWSRLVVLQTGSVALLAFVFGDYAAPLVPLGDHGPVLLAAGAVLLLTGLNLAGLRSSASVQNLLAAGTVAGLVVIVVVALLAPPAAAVPAAVRADPESAFGLAMVFVLLTYGGWNEAAYVSAEVRDVRRRMWRVLVAGLALVMAIYLLVNLAYLRVLGLDAMAASETVTADLARRLLGESGALLVSALIGLAVFGSLNVTILTGARSSYALAKDFPRFGPLGHWSPSLNAPTHALLVQAGIALALIVAGASSRSGFEAMVRYVSPVFWLFFLLTTLSLFVLRRREPGVPRAFRVPGYPWTPLLFAAVCGYMLYASLAYSGWGALAGIALLAAGLPLARRSGGEGPNISQGGSR